MDKEKKREYMKKWARTVNGLVSGIYSDQKRHSKDRGHHLPTYSKEELFLWITNQYHFELLYDNWVSSDYNRWSRPSCDRIDNTKSYTFDNLRLTSWYDNHKQGCIDSKNGVINKQLKPVIATKGSEIIEFISIAEGSRQTGAQKSHIYGVIHHKERRLTAAGYKWSFK